MIDENGIVSRNKARLVAQGYNQQEDIDYDETYALVARLESIRILLAYACALDFKLFQMDVKSALLNSFINEDVYVAEPLRFINFEKPNHVYKLKKALYALKQAPKAWHYALRIVQTALAISTIEAEYVSAKKACQQALWMKQALIDYYISLDGILIMFDNKGAIDLSKNPMQHSCTKHIEIRHHLLHDNVQKGNISIENVPSEDNIADSLSKHLKRESFNYLRLGQCVFTTEWSLDALSAYQETFGLYHTELPTLDEIKTYLQFERTESTRVIKGELVELSSNHILTKEVNRYMKRWEEIIRDNLFSLGGNRDYLLACLALGSMGYELQKNQQYCLLHLQTN
ncbi:copia protein [Tanacetum coccineum]|uniref:Copia protein n=1 Tax=Tanacetum coccineum TaxID=301880 RepID=A0ABQ5BVU8_9ASTR